MSEHQARIARDMRLASERERAIAARAETLAALAAIVHREGPHSPNNAVYVAGEILAAARRAAEHAIDTEFTAATPT